MKIAAVFVATLSVASAFTSQSAGRANTQLSESLADRIFGMDLFSPVKDQNDYGARKKKNLKVAKLGSNSYVPAGLTKAQYEAVRAKDLKKKEASYTKAVSKAFKFQGFDDFYLKRGTQEGGNWLKAPGRGHTFAKTKYDYQGDNQPNYADAKVPEAFTIGSIFKNKNKK